MNVEPFGRGRFAWARRIATTAALGMAGACVPLTPPTEPTQQERFASEVEACHAGDGDGCFAAGMIALEWEGRAPGATEIALANFQRGCDAGDPASCRQLAGRWSTIQPETAGLYRQRACELGDQSSCVAKPDTDAPANPLHRQAALPPPTRHGRTRSRS
jgi:hypothetical protein